MMKTIAAGLAVSAMTAFAAAGSGKLSPADKHFLTVAADTNMLSAHVGQMAENQASGSDVKDFARKLADDHSKSYGEELKLAEKIGDSIPRGINAKRDASVAQLTKLHGAQFDRVFLRNEVADHQRALTEFEREAKHGENPDVKAWAAGMVPVIQQHLNMARELEKSAAHNKGATKRT